MIQSITIEGNEVLEILARILKSPDYAHDIAEVELSRAGQRLVDKEKSVVADRRYSGNLDASIWYKIEGKEGESELIVGPNVAGDIADPDKIWAIWKGGTPGKLWVPLDTLSGWMAARGLPPDKAQAIQWSIFEKGTSVWRRDHGAGTMNWPFPEETLESPEGQDAIKTVADNVTTKVAAWIGEK